MAGQHLGRKRVLNPVERLSETLFGLIMTLSFTGTLSVISGGREEVRTMILSILGCNVAWGIIDAVLYLLGVIGERGRELSLRTAIRNATSTDETREALGEALPPLIADVLQPADIDQIASRIRNVTSASGRVRLTSEDAKGALGVFLIVVSSCIPVIVPFFLVHDPWLALRVSNAVAVLMLFFCGYELAKYAGLPRFWTGMSMVAVGLALVAVTIALGG
jgi:hypothetical protein